MPNPHANRHPRRLRAALLALAALLVATLGPTACGSSSEGDDPNEPETEGITVYSGRIAPLIGPAIDMYEADVDRDVQARFGDSAPLAATLVEEGENSPADVFFAQDAGSLDAVAEAGLLEPLPDRILAMVPPKYRSPDGEWVGVTARSRIIAYGPEVSKEELPDSPLELTEPEWRGRVGWAPTNASLISYITALRAVEGDDVARDWIEGMVANDVQAYESNVPVRDAIASGEIDVGLINHYYVAEAIAEEGPDYPVKVYFPPEDLGSLVNVAGAGVLASSDRKEEAFDFIEFMLEPEAQRYFAESSKEYPLGKGAKPDPSLTPLEEIPAPDVDLGSLTDIEGTIEMLQESGAL